jgi:hypothetical protein
MPRARKTLVSLDTTPYYHCVSRCVRRTFLCGEDKQSGVSFEHRRLWIEDRLLKLPAIFAIDVATFAVLSNHYYHVILYVDHDKARQWTGRVIRDDKRGAIDAGCSPILERLHIEPAQWLILTTRFESRFKSLVGASHQVRLACEKLVWGGGHSKTG